MKRTALLSTLFLLCAATIAAQEPGTRISLNPAQAKKLQAAELFINNFYVDKLEEDKVVDAAIEGMLKQLDPHSAYVKAKDVESNMQNLNGSFEGIGVQFNMLEDTLVVVQPVSGGPSEKVGIMAGDRIVNVDDSTIAGVKMSREEIMRRLRGPKGSKVRLGIMRQGVKGINNFTVTRDKIPVNTLDAAYMANDHVGYIRLSSFGQTTHSEFMKAVYDLEKQGMTALLLDLQSNSGGYLGSAVEIANEFLPGGALIVYTEGRSQKRENYNAKGNGQLQDMPVVVIVDSYTASAAEIVSGALQDNDRGTIVGRRTFGKGLVQRPFKLPDGSMLRLTTAHYYTASGRCIQKPYKRGQRDDYDSDMNYRLKSGELTHDILLEASDTTVQRLRQDLFPDSLRFSTVRLNRPVYGGGGIMPDDYVTLDTARTTPLYRQLSAKGCIISATLKYVNGHRKQLKKSYPAFSDFQQRFQVDDDLLLLVRQEAASKSISIDESAWQATLPDLKNMLKAFTARDLWGMAEYFQIVNPTTDIYRRGLEVASTQPAKLQ